MMRKTIIALMLAFSILAPAGAGEAADLAEDPVAEKRLNEISAELRCLVCQNESLAGSRADLAVDLRREIRTMIHEGKSDAQILDFMVTRYGDFVLYRPPVKPLTWALWFGPALLLLLAGWGLWRLIRRPKDRHQNTPELSPEQQARAKALLDSTSDQP